MIFPVLTLRILDDCYYASPQPSLLNTNHAKFLQLVCVEFSFQASHHLFAVAAILIVPAILIVLATPCKYIPSKYSSFGSMCDPDPVALWLFLQGSPTYFPCSSQKDDKNCPQFQLAAVALPVPLYITVSTDAGKEILQNVPSLPTLFILIALLRTNWYRMPPRG